MIQLKLFLNSMHTFQFLPSSLQENKWGRNSRRHSTTGSMFQRTSYKWEIFITFFFVWLKMRRACRLFSDVAWVLSQVTRPNLSVHTKLDSSWIVNRSGRKDWKKLELMSWRARTFPSLVIRVVFCWPPLQLLLFTWWKASCLLRWSRHIR